VASALLEEADMTSEIRRAVWRGVDGRSVLPMAERSAPNRGELPVAGTAEELPPTEPAVDNSHPSEVEKP